jgi:hypothetical protein
MSAEPQMRRSRTIPIKRREREQKVRRDASGWPIQSSLDPGGSQYKVVPCRDVSNNSPSFVSGTDVSDLPANWRMLDELLKSAGWNVSEGLLTADRRLASKWLAIVLFGESAGDPLRQHRQRPTRLLILRISFDRGTQPGFSYLAEDGAAESHHVQWGRSDEVRLSKRLNVNLGLRYELPLPTIALHYDSLG